MGKIFYLIGKSSTGKDTIYKMLKDDSELSLEPIVRYTTRPIREGEREGDSYFFETVSGYKRLCGMDKIIESQVYHTVHGDWYYFTVDDGRINLENHDYIVIGVLESFASTRDFFGRDRVIPVYIEVDDGERLQRALNREKLPENRRFKEMCRRFLADTEDFSEERIRELEIGDESRFENDNLERCVARIKNYIISVKNQPEV